MDPAEEAARKFFIFAQQWQLVEPESEDPLIDYLAEWLLWGGGLEAIDYDIKLIKQVTRIIVDEENKSPSRLDLRQLRRGRDEGRRKRRGWSPNPSWFNSIVRRRHRS